ncbi:MAG: hypothetical protein U0Z26_11240 [Anaerolineales bacterium]
MEKIKSVLVKKQATLLFLSILFISILIDASIGQLKNTDLLIIISFSTLLTITGILFGYMATRTFVEKTKINIWNWALVFMVTGIIWGSLAILKLYELTR